MKHVLRVLLVVVASIAAWDGHALWAREEIHECKDANGNVIYQDDPCADARPKQQTQRTGGMASVSQRAGEPARTKPTTATAGKKVPASPGHPLRMPEIVERAMGDRLAASPNEAALPADPRFASPEKTWRTFTTALRDGDRGAAFACLTASALTAFGPDAESFPLEKLRETVNAFTRIDVEGDLGPVWSLRASRANSRPKWIFLERTGKGEWKIAAI